jgi:hypothetical protein
MKNFLPFIILILIASLFAILAFYTSRVIEGNTQKKDCEYKWGDWGECVDLSRVRIGTLKQDQAGNGNACPAEQTETQTCRTTSSTTNLATDCTRPNDVTGYEFTSENLLKTAFEVGGLKCASGYYGTPAAVACNSVGQPYSLQGCNRISIEVNTSNPRHLIVNFAKDLSIEGSPGDLKNNFKYKIVPDDTSFKKVENAIVTSQTQIKLVLNADIKINQTVLVKYEQNKGKNNGGAELKINDITVNTIDQISVVNNIIDNISPKVRVIVVENADPQKIKLLMTEHLSPNDNIDKNDFKISVDGGVSRTPNNVTIDGNTMIVHLRSPVTQNQTVKLEYTYDGTDSEKQIKDLNGNLLLDIENLTAINNVGYPNRDLSILSEYTPAEDVEGSDSDSEDTDSSQQNNINQYGPQNEAYFNEQYIKSMGAHNPFNYINDLNNIDCKIDPSNKNRAICDLKRNQPIKQYNLDELRDNRGDEKDKYILKTKIVPVVTPACPTCLDDETDSPTPGLKLNKSLSKLFDVEENLKLDNYDRTVKKNPNLQINKGLKNLMDKVNKNMPQLNKNLSKDVGSTIESGLNTMVPEMITPEMSGPQSSSPQFNMPQVNTPLFKDSLNMPKMTPSMKTPSLNPEVSNVVDKTLDTVSKAAETVNIDTRMLNHNKPTALTHEIAHIKSEGRSGGFIPMLTSFSAF